MWKWLLIMSFSLTVHLQAEIKVLAFAGSTQSASINKKLINAAVSDLRKMHSDVKVIDLKDYPIPLYDADLEKKEGLPKHAKEIRDLMISSHLILIASPEYNGSLSGVLKNLIDWVTRNEQGQGSRDAFKGKKFIIMSASPGSGGGARGLIHLEEIIKNIGGYVASEHFVLPNAYQAFNEEGDLKDPKLKNELERILKNAITINQS